MTALVNVLKAVGEELIGLLIEDSSLAIGIVVWLAVAGLTFAAVGNPTLRALLLAAGLMALLAENVLRSAKKPKKSSPPPEPDSAAAAS